MSVREDKELQALIKKLDGIYGLFMTGTQLASVLKYKDPRSVKGILHEIDIFEDPAHNIPPRYYTKSVAEYIHRNTLRGVIC